MAATPQRGNLTFRGLKSRVSYNVDMYVSDVANALVTLNPSGAAGTASPTSWRAPEDVVLEDYAQVTGTADTTTLVLTQDGAIRNGTILRYSIYLTTLNNRPKLAIPFPAGSFVGGIQLA